MPWNYPLLLLAWKLAPALAAGNVVVAKPSELTPLSTLMLAPCFEHLPAGAMSLLAGAGDVGEAIVSDPRVDCVAFTGSVETGKRIGARCAERVARINLEMGGKDPFIVCADVAGDVRVAARGGAWAAFLNAGQVCTSAERFYVAREVYDDFVSEMVDYTRSLRVGDPLDAQTDVGPMVSAPQRPKVVDQVGAAVDAGAELVVGGDAAGRERGHFYSPAVVTGAAAETDLLSEETFGPVAPVVPVDSLDEAIELANSTRFGLGANVYTRDLATTVRCMREIRRARCGSTIRSPTTTPARSAGSNSRARPGAGPGGPGGLPGDQARAHRDQHRVEGVVVPLRLGLVGPAVGSGRGARPRRA